VSPQNLVLTQNGRVLEIAIDRPDARNALDYATVAELIACLRSAEEDPEVSAVLLYGNGACFSSGGTFESSRLALAKTRSRTTAPGRRGRRS
jgi:enoyl-CoA hydratase/carnithine racemase